MRHDPLSQGARASAAKSFEMISRNTLASLGIEHLVWTWLTMERGGCACNLDAVAMRPIMGALGTEVAVNICGQAPPSELDKCGLCCHHIAMVLTRCCRRDQGVPY